MTDIRRWRTIVETAMTPLNVESLASVRVLADELGVELDVRRIGSKRDGLIRLMRIDRVTASPGSGATVMRALCSFADAAHLEVALEVEDASPGLISYYTNFGFEMRGDPDDAEPLMIRPVQK